MRNLLATISFLALIVIPAAAKQMQREDFEFEQYEKGPCVFKLNDYELTQPVEAGIIFGVECMLETYNDTFGLEFPDDFTVNLVIFSDEGLFNSYYKARFGTDIPAYGYYSLIDNECVVWKNTDVRQMLKVLFHEVNHLLLMHHYPNAPMWLNEGLSQYYEGLNVIGSNKRVYLDNSCRRWNEHWLREGFPVDIAEYVNLDYEQWNELRKKDGAAAYLIGYSLTYFLMETPERRELISKLLLESQNPKETKEKIIEVNGKKYTQTEIITADTTEIIDNIYRGGFRRLEQQWRRWIPNARQYHPVRVLRSRLSENQDNDS